MKLPRIRAALCAVLLLMLLCLPASALDASGTLTLECAARHQGETVLFTGDEYALVKIADAAPGAAGLTYTTLPQYAAQSCDWASLNAEQMTKKARALAKKADPADAVATAVVDAQGRASFTGLAPALYLVLRTQVQPEHIGYRIDPFLVSVPLQLGDELYTCVTAAPKYGQDVPEVPAPGGPTDGPIEGPSGGAPAQPDKLPPPKTGQRTAWALPTALLSGAALLCVRRRLRSQ